MLKRVLDNYMFGFILVTLVYILMVRGLYSAGKSMHIANNVIILAIAMATLLYGLAIATTLYIRRKTRPATKTETINL